jgi:hypothetical protein
MVHEYEALTGHNSFCFFQFFCFVSNNNRNQDGHSNGHVGRNSDRFFSTAGGGQYYDVEKQYIHLHDDTSEFPTASNTPATVKIVPTWPGAAKTRNLIGGLQPGDFLSLSVTTPAPGPAARAQPTPVWQKLDEPEVLSNLITHCCFLSYDEKQNKKVQERTTIMHYG